VSLDAFLQSIDTFNFGRGDSVTEDEANRLQQEIFFKGGIDSSSTASESVQSAKPLIQVEKDAEVI